MNYDLTTPAGWEASIQWTNTTMNQLKVGGVWVVPRSYTTVLVRSHNPKRCKVTHLYPDPSIVEVLKAAGWHLCTDAEDADEIRSKLAEEYSCGFDSPNGT
jgi:hypothetical protein